MAVSDRLDGIVADIVADVPGATEADIRAELARKCREFCQRSRCWRVVFEITSIYPGTTLVNLGNVREGARLWTLDRLWLEGRVPAERAGIRYRLSTCADGGDAVWLSRSPDLNAAFSVTVAGTMQPSVSFAMPEWIYEMFGDGIAAGVIARLKQRVRRPYSDPQGWAEFDHQWRRAINAAAARMAGEYDSAVHRVIDPSASAWTVEDGAERRDVASVPTYAELIQIVRTLCQDLRARGYLPLEGEV